MASLTPCPSSPIILLTEKREKIPTGTRCIPLVSSHIAVFSLCECVLSRHSQRVLKGIHFFSSLSLSLSPYLSPSLLTVAHLSVQSGQRMLLVNQSPILFHLTQDECPMVRSPLHCLHPTARRAGVTGQRHPVVKDQHSN